MKFSDRVPGVELETLKQMNHEMMSCYVAGFTPSWFGVDSREWDGKRDLSEFLGSARIVGPKPVGTEPGA
jgi:hypothetical protein